MLLVKQLINSTLRPSNKIRWLAQSSRAAPCHKTAEVPPRPSTTTREACRIGREQRNPLAFLWRSDDGFRSALPILRTAAVDSPRSTPSSFDNRRSSYRAGRGDLSRCCRRGENCPYRPCSPQW